MTTLIILTLNPANNTYDLLVNGIDRNEPYKVFDIPADVIESMLHRLLVSLEDHHIEGKEKAYGE